MLSELHGGAGVMQAVSWPSRVVGKGSTIETHIRLGSSWSVGGPVLYSSHCPQGRFATFFDNEFETDYI